MMHARITNLEDGKETLEQGEWCICAMLKEGNDGYVTRVYADGHAGLEQKAHVIAHVLAAVSRNLLGDIMLIRLAREYRKREKELCQEL